MKLIDAKNIVSKWLWENPARTSVNREWDNQYITDAAQMLMEAHCKIEQLEVADKALKGENVRLAALRDTKTEELRDLLRHALSKLQVSCNRPTDLIVKIRQHLRLEPDQSPFYRPMRATLPAQRLNQCHHCGKPLGPQSFQRETGRWVATGKLPTFDYCSRECAGKAGPSHAPDTTAPHNPAQK